jgi:hypothetical protein
MSPRLGLAKLALGHVRNKETASVAPGWPSNLGNPKHGISAEAASRDDPPGGSGRLLPPEPFVVNLPNSEVEGVRVGLFGVVRPIGDVEYVEDRVCTFASEPDWLGAGADEDEFDLVGDLTRSLDTFITQLPGRFPAQILPGHRCCRLVERVKLARDLEDDIHASEAIRIPPRPRMPTPTDAGRVSSGPLLASTRAFGASRAGYRGRAGACCQSGHPARCPREKLGTRGKSWVSYPRALTLAETWHGGRGIAFGANHPRP